MWIVADISLTEIPTLNAGVRDTGTVVMPVVDLSRSILAYVSPDDGTSDDGVIGWPGALVQCGSHVFRNILRECTSRDDGRRGAVISNGCSAKCFVAHEQAIHKGRGAGKVVVNGPTLFRARVIDETAIHEDRMCVQVVTDGSTPGKRIIVLKSAIDEFRHPLVRAALPHGSRNHTINSAPFSGSVIDE